ncbi:S1 RNA-binding domain-containing protein [Streptomyces sp. NBC_00669]|uniref:S1 RNA-binding domain-containing protein n=1 Tax=Streptomyces sp. NBC_00669 TaxID=2976011 RepID=UPI002E3272B2|nr:S1 RNA-binding domain-containing protein [Streptomyces sp. NBC_00669]
MDGASEDSAREFLETLHIGDVCTGTAKEVTRPHGVVVTLDGFPARPLGIVGPLELSWRQFPAEDVEAGQRITAEIVSIDLDAGRAQLSMAATENPELWAFLKPLRPGEILSGTIAAIERFGVFVALDDGPVHPVFPGVGFITYPELSWRRYESASDVVQVGQRVSCEFLQFDTWNGEARLSLRATQPDAFPTFADSIVVGQTLQGRVTKVVPFGYFVAVDDGVEGLVHEPPEDIVQVGDETTVVVTEIDRTRHRLALSRRQIPPARE